MIELERIDENNISFYKEYERSFDIDLKKYQSRIYPKKSCDIIHWYHIKSENRYIGAIWLEQNFNEKFAVLGIFIATERNLLRFRCEAVLKEKIFVTTRRKSEEIRGYFKEFQRSCGGNIPFKTLWLAEN